MEQAILEAKKAFEEGEVPVGAVIARNGEIIARAHNQIEINEDVSAHAEVLALKAAGLALNNWRLNDCILCVTLEPCTMCIGAIKLARIPTLIFAAKDPRCGACGSVVDLANDPRLGAVPQLTTGIYEQECSKLLKDFFVEIRKKKK